MLTCGKAVKFGCSQKRLYAVVADLQGQLASIRAKEQQLSRPQKERMYHPTFDPLVRVVMEQLFESELYANVHVPSRELTTRPQ